MCGVYFTTHDRDDCDGFDIEVDNPNKAPTSVYVSLEGSRNLEINKTKFASHHIRYISPLSVEVMVPAKTGPKQIIVPVDIVDDDKEMALALEVSPGEKIDIRTEPCGIVTYVRSLPNLKGFEFSIDNPTGKHFETVEVKFAAENCDVKAGPSAAVSGKTITYKSLAPGKKGVLLAALPATGKQISVSYDLKANEAGAAEPEVVDKKVLENKSVVEVILLPDDAGFEFVVTNDTDSVLDFDVNFKGSQNLLVTEMSPATRSGNMSVTAKKVAIGTKRMVVARLTSIDPAAEDELQYQVESTKPAKPIPAEKKQKLTVETAKEKGKGDGAGSGSKSSASTSTTTTTTTKSKTGLVGRPGRSESQTLKCGMIVKACLLEDLAGYTVDVTNPTSQGFKMIVDFVKMTNVECVAEGGAMQKSDTSVLVEVPPGSKELIVAALPAVNKGKAIAMEYSAKVAPLKN